MTPQQKQKRFVGYIRVSRKNGRQGPSYISPDVQRERIEQWAATHGYKIAPGDWITEEDRSGRAGKKRPEFERLLAQVEGREVAGIVVWKFSRFGRSLIEAALRIQRIEKAGGAVESATEGGQSKLTRNIMLAIAEDEGDRLAETWSDATERAVKRGVWIGKAPLGYRKDRHGRLVEDPVYGKVIREAFRRAAEEGLHAAMAYLQERVPERSWTLSAVRTLLGGAGHGRDGSRTYLGERGRHGMAGGYPGHPALTTVPHFNAAQTTPRGRRDVLPYPLSGVARCGNCGEGLTGQFMHGKYRRYRCSNRACNGGSSIDAGRLEDHVRETVRAALGDGSFGDRFAPGSETEARAAMEQAEAELERFVEVVPATSAVFARGYAKREADLEQARERYQELAGQAARSQSLPMPHELDDPAQFQRALTVLGAIGPVPTVARGRGTVTERVTWEPLDRDVVARELAA